MAEINREELSRLIKQRDELNEQIRSIVGNYDSIVDVLHGVQVKRNIAFIDFEEFSFNGFKVDYELIPNFEESTCSAGNATADCGSCYYDINQNPDDEDNDPRIDTALKKIKFCMEGYAQMYKFFQQMKMQGVEFIADSEDCDAEDFDFNN